MKLVIDQETNTVIAITERAEIVSNGLLCDNHVIGVAVGENGIFTEQFPIVLDFPADAPADLAVHKYKYVDGDFIVNENYMQTPEERIQELEGLLNDATSLLLEAGVL